MKYIKIILELLKWLLIKPSEQERRNREIRKLEKKIQKLYRKRRIAVKYRDEYSFNRINDGLRDLEQRADKLRAGK